MASNTEDRPNRGRPRDLEAKQAILESTRELLLDHGYARLTIEAVAARAKVGKATIYRWWPTKGDLVLEATADHIATGTVPDTGDTREDFLIAIRQSIQALSDPFAQILIHTAMSSVDADSAMAETYRNTWVYPWRESAMQAVKRGVDRGDLPSDLDVALILDVIVGTVLLRTMVQGQTVLEGLDTALTDLVFPRSKSHPGTEG